MSEAQSAAPWSTEGGFLPADFPVPPIQGVGDALSRTSNLFIENLKTIALIDFSVFVPVSLLKDYLIYSTGNDENFALLFRLESGVEWIFGSLVSPAIIYAVVKKMRGNGDATVGEAYGWGLQRWGATAGYTWLVGLITIIGLVLLIVPGIIAMLMLALVVPIVAVEGTQSVSPLQRSRELTTGVRGTLLGTAVVAFIGFLFLSISLAIPLMVIDTWYMSAGASIVGGVGYRFLTVMILLFYLAAPGRAKMDAGSFTTLNLRA